MTGTKRIDITPGTRVKIVTKAAQRTGEMTEGTVHKILTNAPTHPHGIKVLLEDGTVGRVKAIIDETAEKES